MFGKTNNIHFIGIGGIGMSGMAELLYKLGFHITGSDIKFSERTDDLIKLGIEVSEGHQKSNINGSDVVVFSSAIKMDSLSFPHKIEFIMVGLLPDEPHK